MRTPCRSRIVLAFAYGRSFRHRRQGLARQSFFHKPGEHTFDALREDYVNIYDLQLVILKTIAKENGDLGRALPPTQQKLSDHKRLAAERDKLLKDEQGSLQRLQEQYAAFKGMTSITLDYVAPPAPR